MIANYEQKLEHLKEELELRMKVEIHEIEERKNQHINDLMKNHQEAFKEMKEYYNDITRENLELIKMHKEKLVDIRAQIEANQKTVDHCLALVAAVVEQEQCLFLYYLMLLQLRLEVSQEADSHTLQPRVFFPTYLA